MLKVSEIDVYYGDMQALRNVSIDVNQGEVVSVIGSNGAGKSTLLKAVSGMLRPRTGSISLNGNAISQVPTSKIVENGISHVPEGRQIFPSMTVLENLEMGAQFPRTRKGRDETMKQVFTYFPRLKERLEQKAGTLSGGEQGDRTRSSMRHDVQHDGLHTSTDADLALSPVGVNQIGCIFS